MQLPVPDGWAVTLQQSFESARIQEIKRLYYQISAQVLTVVTYPDASHTCAACTFDTGSGVFYNNAPLGRYAEARSRSQIHFRVRFSLADIFSGDDSLKTVSSRESFKDHLDVRTRGRRRNRLKPTLLVKPVYATCNSG